MDSLAKSILFPLAIKALHSVLNLVYRLLFAVKSLESNQIERVTEQVALNGHVKGRVGGQRRAQINLNEPRFQI